VGRVEAYGCRRARVVPGSAGDPALVRLRLPPVAPPAAAAEPPCRRVSAVTLTIRSNTYAPGNDTSVARTTRNRSSTPRVAAAGGRNFRVGNGTKWARRSDRPPTPGRTKC